MKNKKYFTDTFIYALSFSIIVFLLWWIYLRPSNDTSYVWIKYLPFLNVFLNSLSAIFLVFGFFAIKKKKIEIHIKLMSLATLSSFFFLVSYLVYHYFHGDTKFIGEGTVRIIYFSILISHIILSIAMVPMLLMTLKNALTSQIERHIKWARWTFPIWLYVSITGVLIVVILKRFNY